MFFFIYYKIDKNIINDKKFFSEENKFKIYRNIINKNYNKKQLELFIKAQNIYHKLNTFILNYKLKKYIPSNDTDMYLDKINKKSSKTIKLLIDNKIFLFTIRDIIHIINSHLLHCNSSDIIEPSHIRNPYTNSKLQKHNLYNIYFSLKNKNIFHQIYYIFFQKKF